MTCKRQSDLQKTSESQDTTREQVPFEKPWRSHSTAICTDWIAKHNRIATHYCRTHRFDALVSMHKVSQDMQNTIAQHQQRREKVTWNPQLHCARKSSRIRRQSGDAATAAHASQLFSATEAPFTGKKTQCFVRILAFKSHQRCSSSNAIHQQWPAKDNQNRNLCSTSASSLLYSTLLFSALLYFYLFSSLL